jgi:hypothetical protein
MAEPFGQYLRVDAGAEPDRRMRVSQIVDAKVAELSAREDRFEVRAPEESNVLKWALAPVRQRLTMPLRS